MENNQLSEARPSSLSELFARDPLTLTDEEVDRIVAEMRDARERWYKEETEAKAKGRRANPAAANIKLDELDIEI